MSRETIRQRLRIAPFETVYQPWDFLCSIRHGDLQLSCCGTRWAAQKLQKSLPTLSPTPPIGRLVIGKPNSTTDYTREKGKNDENGPVECSAGSELTRTGSANEEGTRFGSFVVELRDLYVLGAQKVLRDPRGGGLRA